MLQGKWPQGGCEYCQQIEQAGGASDRQLHLQIPNLVPVELEEDSTAVKVSPKILEIYFNNTCNLACVYCWDGFSSKIEQENRKFGDFVQSGVVIKNTSSRADLKGLTAAFWSWFGDNCQSLGRLHVLGGEPFYQDDFYKCLSCLVLKDEDPYLTSIFEHVLFGKQDIRIVFLADILIKVVEI
jgi:hypothetical protein